MTAVTFGRGMPAPTKSFEPVMLPLSQKERLCRDLLTEFGVTNVYERAKDHELIHGCLIDPTHTRQDSEPTASLNYERLAYRCLGCGARGGLLWFIAQCRGEEDTKAARKWLFDEVGLNGSAMEVSKLMAFFDSLYDVKVSTPQIPTYSNRMLEPWAFLHPYLTDPRDQYGRGIPEQNVIDARIGYAEEYVVRTGVDANGKAVYGTSERIVIPHFWKERLVGWQTRRLYPDGTAKYVSSPDFPKDSTIYNYQPRSRRTVVTEAALSVVAHLHAVPEGEATFGASLTEIQVNLLAKHPRLVLCFDNDDAGWKAVEGYDTLSPTGRLIKHHEGLGEILSRSSDVLVWENPYAADPADMTTEDYLELIENAVPFSVWRRPETLLCYSCKAIAHAGACS